MTYSIGQVAEQYNLSIHTLRYYEKEGILPFVKRTPSGIRKFDDDALEGLRVVECLKKTNMPLKDIKVFLDWCQEGNDTLEKRRDMFYEQKQAVLDQIAELQETLKLIDFKCWYYESALELGSEEEIRKIPLEEMPEEIQKLYRESHGEFSQDSME